MVEQPATSPPSTFRSEKEKNLSKGAAMAVPIILRYLSFGKYSQRFCKAAELFTEFEKFCLPLVFIEPIRNILNWLIETNTKCVSGLMGLYVFMDMQECTFVAFSRLFAADIKKRFQIFLRERCYFVSWCMFNLRADYTWPESPGCLKFVVHS